MSRTSHGTAGNVDFEVDSEWLLSIGAAVAVYLNAHPDIAAAASPIELRAALASMGLRIRELVRADLDGDGNDEWVGDRWVFVRTGADLAPKVPPGVGPHPHPRWRAVPLPHLASGAPLGQPQQLPSHPGLVVPLDFDPGKPATTLLGLNPANRLPQLFRPDGTPLPQVESFFSGGCTIAEGLKG